MSKFVSLLITVMVMLVSMSSFAYAPPPAPANGGYVVDQAGKLSADQIQQLNQKIDRISKATQNEFGILLLQSMEGDNIEDVANATYKSWGVGKRGLDNGCLIVVAIKEHKSRIETGKGVEGEVTDLQASDLLKNNLNPHLKRGDFFGGFNATLDGLSGLMETRANQKADPKPVVNVPVVAQDSSGVNATPDLGIFLVLGLGGLALFIIFMAVRAHMREQERLAKLAREEVRLANDQRHKETERRAKLAQDELNRMAKVHQQELNQKANEILNGMYHTHGEPASPYRSPSHPPREPKPVIHVPRQPLNRDYIKPEVAVAASSVAIAAEAERRREAAHRQQEEDLREAHRREQEREEENRRRREREEEDERARRRREEESSSSSSSFDWGSSSSSSDSGWGGGSDSGGGFGGFGGGDSGGGGSSSDW